MLLFLQKIKEDTHYRIMLLLRLTLFFNITYSVFLLVVSNVYSSRWFFAVSIYHALLFAVRILLLKGVGGNKTEHREIITVRFCGYLMLLINLAVSAMMLILVRESNRTGYHEIIVITIATYTFSALTLAIVGYIKWLKQKNRVFHLIKLTGLVSASVSLVCLTDTMLSSFGEDNILLRKIVLPILSAAVAIFIVFIAISVIRRANSNLRDLKNEEK